MAFMKEREESKKEKVQGIWRMSKQFFQEVLSGHHEPADYELLEAVRDNDLPAVQRILMEKEINLNLVDPDDPLGQTALTLATTNKNRGIVNILIQCDRIDLNRCNKQGESALYIAAKNNDSRIVTALLDWGADQNESVNGVTPLVVAIQNNFSFIVKLLVSRHTADLEAVDDNGNTPLTLAVEKGNPYIVMLLVRKGADIMAQNNNGVTPISIAESMPNSEELLAILRNESTSGFDSNVNSDDELGKD